MERLLDEIIVLILRDHLAPDDLFTCRRVCKRFKFLVDNCVNLRQLSIRPFLDCFRIDFFYLTGERLNLKNLLLMRNLPTSPDSSFQIVFANLRTLQIAIRINENALASLNAFLMLEKLTIDTLVLSKKITLNNPFTLNLPNLKVLAIAYLSWAPTYDLIEKKLDKPGRMKRSRLLRANEIKAMLIVGPRIEMLYVDHHQSVSIHLTHPEHVSSLWLNDTAMLSNELSSLKKLTTLKFISCFEPCLNLLQVCESLQRIYFEYYPLNSHVVEKFVDHLLAERSLLKRLELKIYINDLLITDMSELSHVYSKNAKLNKLPADG